MRAFLLPILAAVAVAIPACVTSCSPLGNPPPRAIIVPKASKPVNLAPAVASAAKASAQGKAAGDAITSTGKAVQDADAAIEKAQPLADGNSELIGLLAAARAEIAIARASTDQAAGQIRQQAVTIESLGQQLQTASTDLAARDAELAQYRQALPQANATIRDDAKVQKAIPGLIAGKAANGVYKHAIWFVAGGIVILLLIYLGLKAAQASAQVAAKTIAPPL